MSKAKAKEFLTYLIEHPEAIEKMKGFTHEELKDAALDLKGEGREVGNIEPHLGF